MLEERLGGNCMTVGVFSTRDSLMNLYYCYPIKSSDGWRSGFDEVTLHRMKDLMKKAVMGQR